MSKCEPTKAQKAWMQLGYGMFIHFGVNTFEGKAWGDGKFNAKQFKPEKLNTRQWAEVAAEAGMKYAVLTAKHHDGFCLWPSKHTGYSVRSSPGGTDVVGKYVEAFSKAGLKVGLYYSLWDKHFPDYETDDVAYAQYMQEQMRELLTSYGPILEMWFDGGWDKDHPTREWPFEPKWERNPKSGLGHGERWRWKELYDMIHGTQPDCLVIQNSSSDRPGVVKYHPVDVRTSEHYDFIWQEKICPPVTDNIVKDDRGRKIFVPLEYCTSLNRSWFWAEGQCQNHPSVSTICDWYSRARAGGANLLLNVGPNNDGLVPEYHRFFLKAAAKRLDL